MNQFLLVSTLFVVAGCATPSPEPSNSESVQATESSSSELPEHIDPVEDFEDAEVVAGNYESSESIEDVEAPDVDESPAALVQQPRMVEPEVVCEWTVPTGSVLKVKVCRKQADIDRNRLTDQELMDDIKQSTVNGASRL